MSESELERSRRVNARPSNKKPLSDDEAIQVACDTFYGLIKKEERDNFIRFARAIEERHGIK